MAAAAAAAAEGYTGATTGGVGPTYGVGYWDGVAAAAAECWRWKGIGKYDPLVLVPALE